MARNLANLIDEVEIVAAGRLDARLDPAQIVNDAGEYLVAMHPWEFLERAAVTLNIVSGQNHIDLPPDFREIVGLETGNNWYREIHIKTLGEIEALRGSIEGSTLDFYVAPEWPSQEDKQSPPPNARLAIYPNNIATSSDSIKLIYKAGWRTLSEMEDVPNIPTDMGPLLVDLVRAHTKAFAFGVSLGEVLDPIEQSSYTLTLKRRYGGVTTDLGQMRGGITTYRTYRRRTDLFNGTIDINGGN